MPISHSHFIRAGMLMVPGIFWFVLFPMGCASPSQREEKTATIQDLDSLHWVARHQDSVDANLLFYEEAFTAYREKFPGVDKPAFMAIAQGKDQAFCLFQPDPAKTCLTVADKYNDLGLKESARDSYEAGLLSEGANESKLNIRLWSSLAQLHFEFKEYAPAKAYLTRVLEVEPKNVWAKRLMGDLTRKEGGG